MTRQSWLSEIVPLIARVNRIDPMRAEHHPAYRAALRRIDRLIETGLQHDYITQEEACRL